MNILNLMTMTLWFAMCMATDNYSADKNTDDSFSRASSINSITNPRKEPSQKGYDEKAKDFEKEFERLSKQGLTEEEAAKELEKSHPENFHFHDVPEFSQEDVPKKQDDEEAEEKKVETDSQKVEVSEHFAQTDSQKVEEPRTLEKFVQTDSQEVAPKGNCSLCEMDVLKDGRVQCDTCGEFQKAGDKVLGNNDCHCYGRNGNHHCADCSKEIWGKDLHEGEEIVGERPAGTLFVTPVLNENGLRHDLIKLPEKCDKCHKLTGQHVFQEDKMHTQKNGKEICDECHMMKQAREQQRREKNIPSGTQKGHGTGTAPKIVSLNHKTEKGAGKTPEDSTLKKRIIYLSIAIAAIILILSIGVCCKKKPKKRTLRAPQNEIIVREVRSQPEKVHIIRV